MRKFEGMIGKTLRIGRIVVQAVVMLAFTALLVATPTAAVMALKGGLKASMLFPLALSGTLLAVLVWIAVTLLLGRVYCSTICPIGTLQDVAARLRRILWRGGSFPYRHSPGQPRNMRMLLIILLIVTAGLGTAANGWALMPFIQISPSDSYEHMVNAIAPQQHHPGLRLMIAAAINFVFVVAMGAFCGRELCNKLCPLGASLGALSQMSLMQIDIDTDRCTHCRRCEDVCKAMCLDSEIGTTDASRCVRCFDCLAVCPDDAIHFTRRRHRLSIPMLQKIEKPALNLQNPENQD